MGKKRIQSILLICILIMAGLFAGCSKEQENTGDSDISAVLYDVYNDNLTKYFSLRESDLYSSIAITEDVFINRYWEELTPDFDNETPLGGDITDSHPGRMEKNILSYSRKHVSE